jgi:Tat protein translocase TatB subunit
VQRGRPYSLFVPFVIALGVFDIGLPELLVILIVALLVFGPKRLPQVARTIGRTIMDIRKMADDVKDTVREELQREEENKGEEKGSGG